MPRRIQPTYTKGQGLVVGAMGDSLSHNLTLQVWPDELWPERLAVALRSHGVGIRSRNAARNGSTTTQMIARIPRLVYPAAPDIAVIMGGVNDPGGGIAQATTKANIEAMINALMTAGTWYVVVVSTQYLNWASGGDTLATAEFSGSGYGAVRTAERDAAVARAAVYPGRVAYCSL